MYDPTSGRWFEEDPIGFDAGDTNLYRFEGNSPTNFTDPSGLAVNAASPGSSSNQKQGKPPPQPADTVAEVKSAPPGGEWTRQPVPVTVGNFKDGKLVVEQVFREGLVRVETIAGGDKEPSEHAFEAKGPGSGSTGTSKPAPTAPGYVDVDPSVAHAQIEAYLNGGPRPTWMILPGMDEPYFNEGLYWFTASSGPSSEQIKKYTPQPGGPADWRVLNVMWGGGGDPNHSLKPDYTIEGIAAVVSGGTVAHRLYRLWRAAETRAAPIRTTPSGLSKEKHDLVMEVTKGKKPYEALNQLSAAERKQAAEFFKSVETKGPNAAEAKAFNEYRAKFIEEGGEAPKSLAHFIKEILPKLKQ